MSLRRLPPVHSPLSGPALRAGLHASLSPGEGARARAEVETWLAATFAPRAVLLLDSGTSALALALVAAAGRGGRVALPAWGCYDLATACDAAQVEVLLYDLDPATLGPDWASLREALAQGVAAVVVAHFYGLPVAMAEVRALAAERGAVVIEDAAQGTGASLAGRPAGSFGDLAVLSFGRGKGLTGGRGGALLCHAASLVTNVAALTPGGNAGAGVAEVGKSLAQLVLARPSLYALPSAIPFLRLGETIYHPAHAAAPLPRSAAGILSRTLRLADAEAARRRGNAARLLAAVKAGGALIAIEPVPGAVPGYLRLPLLDPAPSRRTREPAAGALGVMPGYPIPLALLPGFAARVRNQGASLPGARVLADRLATLPTHGLLTEADLSRLERWLAA